MVRSLSEFQSLTGTELDRIFEHGPVLITDDEEPCFVAQSIEDFEAMVRRLRSFEQASLQRGKLRVIPPRIGEQPSEILRGPNVRQQWRKGVAIQTDRHAQRLLAQKYERKCCTHRV